MKYELGETVKDKITGFMGIVVTRCEYMYSTPRYEVQPNKVKEDGSMIESNWFDEPQLQKA